MNSTNKTEDYFIYYKMIEGIFYNFIAIRYDKANIVKWHRFKCRFNLEGKSKFLKEQENIMIKEIRLIKNLVDHLTLLTLL